MSGLAHAPDESADSGAEPSGAMWVALRYYALARLLIASVLVLVGLQFFSELGILASPPGAPVPAALRVCLIGYWVLSMLYVLALQVERTHFGVHLVLHVMTDLVALVLLSALWEELSGGLAVLQVAILAAAAVVSTRRQAAAFAAVLSLLVIAQALWHQISGQANGLPLVQAGLEGAAGFATALGVNFLALRLEREAQRARAASEDVRAQLAVTRLAIAQLPQAVVVLDGNGLPRVLNPAAIELLALPAPPQEESTALAASPKVLRTSARWRELVQALALGEAGADPGALEREFVFDADSATPLPVRVRLMRPPGDRNTRVVVIEDLRRLEEQARQLKLASMGRLAASIAHEIRNPLAAIRHANELLAEQLQEPGARRLAGIIEGNTVRIDRIIEDVLSVSRRQPAVAHRLVAADVVPAIVAEFVQTAEHDAARIECDCAETSALVFDPNHLRQVLINLLGNALRHASAKPGAVRVRWMSGAGHRLELAVEDDGPGVAPDVAQHLFEPFLTTEARGTGLGLYLARELCHANGASLHYEAPGPDCRSRFVIRPRSLLDASDG
jgi:two-component system, NtrC family, sensor histidine kinase PilS